MADQEFLASFGVEIDETGVLRLQEELTKNRTLAEELASAFDAARESVQSFFEELSTLSSSGFSGLTGGVTEETSSLSIPLSLDTASATRALASFRNSARTALRLSADASGVISAGQAALAQLQSQYSAAKLTLNVQENRTVTSAGGDSTVGSAVTGSFFSSLLKSAAGGRFDRPTTTQIAEDGDPEYVIPVKKESLAVPLLRQLMGELSDSARETLLAAFPGRENTGSNPAGQSETEDFGNGNMGSAGSPRANPFGEEASGGWLSALPDYLSSAASATAPVIHQSSHASVQAPVSINVTAAGSNPEAVGRSIYDVTEQYLLRTLQNAI